MTRSKLDEEAWRLADKAELGDPSRFELDEMADCLRRLVEENGRMRRAAEKTMAGQGRCAHDPDDPDRWAKCNLTEPPFCDFCQGMQELAAIVTPTPAVEAKPKCQRCADKGLVPTPGAPGFFDLCACIPRPGPEHYIQSKPKCGTCNGTTRIPQRDDNGVPIYSAPCPSCTKPPTDGEKR